MKKLAIYFLGFMICIGVALLLQSQMVFAADETVNEDDLFSGSETVVTEEEIVKDDVAEELNEKRIGFSGQINASSTYNSFDPYVLASEWTGEVSNAQELLNRVDADFFVDIRLQNGIKGFLSAGLDYSPIVSDPSDPDTPIVNITNIKVNEFFVDANWKNRVYFRTGKQVLKWGTGYFWNPSDLINIDRKDFLDMSGVMEGTFGTKIQIPSGTKQNVYFFVGMNEAQTVEALSLAAKYEFLVGGTEMSFSALARNGYKPFYGYDVTGRIGSIDVWGEIGLSPGDEQKKLDYDTLDPVTEEGWVPRASFGFTKSFDHGDIQDRISITNEFYYNAAGYDENIFQRIVDDGVPATFFTDYYIKQPYMISKYYMAFFSSVRKFIVSDLTLNINGIANLVDHSATLSTGVSYTPALTDFTLSFSINRNFGDPNTEATFLGNEYSLSLGAKISF